MNADLLERVVRIMADDGLSEAERNQKVLDCVGDPGLAKRAVEWLPEAFGWVLLSRVPDVRVPRTFHVRDTKGGWHEYDFSAEPLFREAVLLANEMAGPGAKGLFEKLALSSSLVASLNAALNAGADIRGAVVSGPAFVNLPAEIYG